MHEQSLPILLSGFDIIFLSDALRNGDSVKSKDDELPCLENLILLLGSAYIEAMSQDLTIEQELYVTKPMCWLMRSKVHTGDIGCDGQTMIGVELLKELYRVMLEFDSDMSDLVTSDTESPMLTEEMLADLKEQAYVTRWRPDENSYPSRDTIREP